MSEQKTQLTCQQQGVIELLKAHVQSQKDAIQAIENKAQHNFTIINIIAAFVAALNLRLGETNEIQQIINNRPLLILIFIGYIVIALLSLKALWLRTQSTEPMKVTLKNAQDWSSCELEQYYHILVRSYQDIYDDNGKIVDSKVFMVKWAHRLLAIVIVLIFLEASAGLLLLLPSWVENIFNQLSR